MANLTSTVFAYVLKLNLPITVSILAGILSIILVFGFRISFRVYRRSVVKLTHQESENFVRVMVIGAGYAASSIIKDMKNSRIEKYNPVVIVDDSSYKQGTQIAGVRVEGKRGDIEALCKKHQVQMILIAIPSLGSTSKKEIIDICKGTGCMVKILPAMQDLIDSKVSLNAARNVEIDDLLGRDPIKLDMQGIAEYIKDRVIIVTGGGGSIGSELCRQIAKFKPKKLLVLDIYENNAYDLQNELKYNYPELNLKVIIASVRDRKRLEKIFAEERPEVLFHAAAHKHVPLMEDNPTEAIKNNVFGTLNLAELADKYSLKKFVMISTDKAVNPTNVMGASKRICEMIVQAMDKRSQTEFVAVRFGNVLGSNGSVIPLFKKQISHGGPLTITHRDITRFFMTIPEAAQLVLQASAYAEGGEIFVLDMGSPVKIYDLACDLIKLSGLEPYKDIDIEIVGLRPGEKLYEELLMDTEGLNNTSHEKIFVGRPTFTDLDELKRNFDELRFVSENGNKEELKIKIASIVPTYTPSHKDKTALNETEEQIAAGK